MSITLLTYVLYGLLYREKRERSIYAETDKCRKVCHFPNVLEFLPANKNGGRGEEKNRPLF